MLRSLSIDTEMKKMDLLETLKANRERHTKFYKEALEGYVDAAKVKLGLELDKLVGGKIIAIGIHLSVPEDHTADYDTVIGMYERDVRDTVVLDASAYRMLVEDKWDWSHRWHTNNAAYSESIRGIGFGDLVEDILSPGT
jgi:hypothetical protein